MIINGQADLVSFSLHKKDIVSFLCSASDRIYISSNLINLVDLWYILQKVHLFGFQFPDHQVPFEN